MSAAPFRLRATVLDSRDPVRLAHFYERLLSWPIDSEDPTWVTLRDPNGGAGLSFQLEPLHVAPSWPAREVAEQMQLHLDIAVDELETAVQQAVAAGATQADFQPQEDVRVLLDPDGHPFCLFELPR